MSVSHGSSSRGDWRHGLPQAWRDMLLADSSSRQCWLTLRLDVLSFFLLKRASGEIRHEALFYSFPSFRSSSGDIMLSTGAFNGADEDQLA